MKKAGFSSEGAETFTRAKGIGETINLGELSDSDISLLRDKVANSRSGSYYGLTSEDLQNYDAKGGSLGARNASFSELYQAVENPAEGSNEEALAQLKTFRDEALSIYNELNEEDKRLFAETMDFKTVTNAETMKQILAQEKEARADAKIESDAEKYDLDANVVKAQADQIKKSLESVAKSQDKTNKSGKNLEKGLKQTNLEMKDAAEIAA